MEYKKLSDRRKAETSEAIHARVEAERQIQLERFMVQVKGARMRVLFRLTPTSSHITNLTVWSYKLKKGVGGLALFRPTKAVRIPA